VLTYLKVRGGGVNACSAPLTKKSYNSSMKKLLLAFLLSFAVLSSATECKGKYQSEHPTAECYVQSKHPTHKGYVQTKSPTQGNFTQGKHPTKKGYVQDKHPTADGYIHNKSVLE